MKKTVVLLSGGQDSATCLALAKLKYDEIHTIAFDYGQRHKIELECSAKLSTLAGAIHHVIPINSFKYLVKSNLLNSYGNINDKHINDEKLPSSFVPGRNIVFLTFAGALAYSLGINELITGVCQTDFSGYPDCRRPTIDAIEAALTFGLAEEIIIHTPLMFLTKAQSIDLMRGLGHFDWYKHTHTCYNGKRPPCGECPACKLRAKGFAECGLIDPLFD